MRCCDIHSHTVPRGMVRDRALMRCPRPDMARPFVDILVNDVACFIGFVPGRAFIEH